MTKEYLFKEKTKKQKSAVPEKEIEAIEALVEDSDPIKKGFGMTRKRGSKSFCNGKTRSRAGKKSSYDRQRKVSPEKVREPVSRRKC